MNENDRRAMRIKELTDSISEVINESQISIIGDKFQALAYASAWFMLHVGGPAGMDEAKELFIASIDDFCSHLEPSDLVSAIESNKRLKEAVGG